MRAAAARVPGARRAVTSCRATSAVVRTTWPSSNPSHRRSAPCACSICTGTGTRRDSSARSTKSSWTNACPFHRLTSDGRAKAPVVSVPRTSIGPANSAVGSACSANVREPSDCSAIRFTSFRSNCIGSSPRSSRYATWPSRTTTWCCASSQSSAGVPSDSAWPGSMTKPATVTLPSARRTTDTSGDNRRSATKRGSIDARLSHDTVASTRGSASGGPPRGPVTCTSSSDEVRIEAAPARFDPPHGDGALQRAAGDVLDLRPPLVDARQDVVAGDEQQRAEREVGRQQRPEREAQRRAHRAQRAEAVAARDRLFRDLDAVFEPFLDGVLDPVRGGTQFGGKGRVAPGVAARRRRIRARLVGHERYGAGMWTASSGLAQALRRMRTSIRSPIRSGLARPVGRRPCWDRGTLSQRPSQPSADSTANKSERSGLPGRARLARRARPARRRAVAVALRRAHAAARGRRRRRAASGAAVGLGAGGLAGGAHWRANSGSPRRRRPTAWRPTCAGCAGA